MIAAWILIGFTGLILLSMLLSQLLIAPRHREEPVTPADYGLNFEPVEFKSRDGIALRGWWIPAESSTRSIIFLHGYHGSKAPDLQYASFFHDQRFNMILFDFRGHGSSDGQMTSLGALERLDALAAVDLAARKGSTHIGLLGFSMGGRAAVLAGAESAQVDAIVCDCGPARISTSIELDLMRRGVPQFLARGTAAFILFGASLRCRVNLFAYEPIRKAEELCGKPAFFMQGSNDPHIRVNETLEMVRRAGENASLWLVEDASHRDISDIHPQEYRSRLVEFFESALPA